MFLTNCISPPSRCYTWLSFLFLEWSTNILTKISGTVPVVLIWRWFSFPVYVWKCLETFLCHTWLWRCYSYLVNGSPESCRTSCILWTLHSKPQTKNFQLKMSVMLILGKVMFYPVPPKSSTLSKAPQ